MSAPAYSLEESLERAVDTVLSADANLAGCRITSADESDEERNERRLPDPDDNDEGAAGFKELWHDLWATVDGPNFLTNLNATDLVKVWGIEFDPVSYENETRSFRRSINLRCWVNEAYPAA